MELRQLRYFLTVAQELNFTRAAEVLHMAQPPLSQQIKSLEQQVGFELFYRTTRRVDLTPAGAYLAERVRGVLNDLELVVEEARTIAAGAKGVVRIGFVGTATLSVMPEVLRFARQELPDVKVVVEGEMLTPEIEERLRRGLLDIAVIRPPVSSPDICVEVLREDRFQVAFSASDPFAAEDGPLDIADLRERGFVSYPANAAAAIMLYGACREAGFLPRIAHETDRMSTLMTLVSVGEGIAVVPAGSAPTAQFPVSFRELTGIPRIGLAISRLYGQTDLLVSNFSGMLRRMLGGAD